MDLSILIVNWNTREPLRRCLASLRDALAGSPLRAEIVVVDNASQDGSAAMVDAEFPEVRLVANAENRNYAGGTNQGLACCTGELVLLLNPDTEVPPGALERLATFLRDRPQAAAVAPALVGTDGAVQASVRGFPSPAALVGAFTGLGRLFPGSVWAAYRPRDLPQDRASPVDQPMASALLLRRGTLVALGGLDEGFPLFFNDVDLCWRLRERGGEIWYDPTVRIRHEGGAATRQVRQEAIRLSHGGLLRFYRLHYRDRIPAPVYALTTAAIAAAGALRRLRARLVPGAQTPT